MSYRWNGSQNNWLSAHSFLSSELLHIFPVPLEIKMLVAAWASIQKSVDHRHRTYWAISYSRPFSEQSHTLGNSHPVFQHHRWAQLIEIIKKSLNCSFCFGSRYLSLVQNLSLFKKLLGQSLCPHEAGRPDTMTWGFHCARLDCKSSECISYSQPPAWPAAKDKEACQRWGQRWKASYTSLIERWECFKGQ